MRKDFHHTDGALLGSCGDIRHDATEAVALHTSYQAAHAVATLAQGLGQGVAEWRANRAARFEAKHSALAEHDEVASLLAARRARQQAQAPKPTAPSMKFG